MSLLSFLLHDALRKPEPSTAPDGSFALNYGFDRLRLVTPVPVNSRIRGRFTLVDVTRDAQGRTIQRLGTTVEIEGMERPALVAEWLFMWLPAHDTAGT
jgi:acyl dehydratase